MILSRQTIQTRQFIGSQMNYAKNLLLVASDKKQLAKSLTKNDLRTQTRSGRKNVQKLRQQLTARLR